MLIIALLVGVIGHLKYALRSLKIRVMVTQNTRLVTSC